MHRKVFLHEKLIDYEAVLLLDIHGDAQSLGQLTLRYDGETTSTVLGTQLERLCYQRYLEPLYVDRSIKMVLSDEDHYQLYMRYKYKSIECEPITEKECELEKSMLQCIKEEWSSKAKMLVKAAKMNNTMTGTARNNAVDHLLKLMKLSQNDLTVLRYWSTGFWRKSE
jgi:hypothetical protein